VKLHLWHPLIAVDMWPHLCLTYQHVTSLAYSEYLKYDSTVKNLLNILDGFFLLFFFQVDAMAMVQSFVTYLVQSLQLKLLARSTNTALSRYRNDLNFFPLL